MGSPNAYSSFLSEVSRLSMGDPVLVAGDSFYDESSGTVRAYEGRSSMFILWCVFSPRLDFAPGVVTYSFAFAPEEGTNTSSVGYKSG